MQYSRHIEGISIFSIRLMHNEGGISIDKLKMRRIYRVPNKPTPSFLQQEVIRSRTGTCRNL